MAGDQCVRQGAVEMRWEGQQEGKGWVIVEGLIDHHKKDS